MLLIKPDGASKANIVPPSTSLPTTTVNNLYYNLCIEFTRSFIQPYLFLNEPHLRLAFYEWPGKTGQVALRCEYNELLFQKIKENPVFMTCLLQWNSKAALQPDYYCQKTNNTFHPSPLTHKHTHPTKSTSQYRPRRFCDRAHKNVRQTNNQTQTLQMCASQSHQQTSLFGFFPQVLFFPKQLCRRASAVLRCFQACNYRGLACCIFNYFIARRDVLGKKPNANIEVSGDYN